MLILDDATSSVDASTEQQIKAALAEAMAGRTTFVIAHRLSTISLADEIVLLEGGRVAAQGTHDELLRGLALYREIVERGLPEPVFLTRKPRGGRGGGAVRPAPDARTCCAGCAATGGRGRKLRGLLELLRPYRSRVADDAGGAGAWPPPPPWRPAPLAKLAIDDGIMAGDVSTLNLVVVRLRRARAGLLWAGQLAADLPGRAGWASGRCRTCASGSSRTCRRSRSASTRAGRAGVLVSRMTNDVQALDQLVTDGVVTLFQSTLTLLGTVAILFVAGRQLAVLTFLVVPVRPLASLAFRLASADAYRITREKIAWITSYLQETLSGVRVVRAFGQEPRHRAAFAAAQRGEPPGEHAHGVPERRLLPGDRADVGALATVGILLYGGYQAIEGEVTIGVLVAFIAALNSFFDPIQQLSQLYTTYQSGMAALDKIFELLDEEPDLVDRRGRVDAAADRGEIWRSRACPSATAGRGAWALRDVTCTVPAGQTVALVGATGAGKSTLAKLVGALLRPDGGAGAGRRRGPARRARLLAALAARRGAAGGLPVLGHDRRQHRLRPPGGQRRGGRGGGPRRWARTSSSRRLARATTPRWASAGRSCQRRPAPARSRSRAR